MKTSSTQSSDRRRQPAFRLPHSSRARGFTLVELLVVITIIALLAGLLLPAIARARWVARQTAIKAEISNLETALESYKNDVSGGSYPPNPMVGVVGSGTGETPAALANRIFNDFKRHMKKAFPQSREDDDLYRALSGLQPRNPNSATLPGGMTPAETLVFFLQRFSSDPKYPISGPGGPAFSIDDDTENLADRNWIIDFAPDRYGPRNDQNLFAGRGLQYPEPFDFDGDGNQDQLQISLWTYTPANSEVTIAYFDASRGIRDVDHQSFPAVYPLKQLKAGAFEATPQVLRDVRLVNEDKFQILHCGNDQEWGDFGVVRLDPAWYAGDGNTDPATQTALSVSTGDPILLYPTGPFTIDLADTVTNVGSQIALEDAE